MARRRRSRKSKNNYTVAGVVIAVVVLIVALNAAPEGRFFGAFQDLFGPDEVVSADGVDFIPRLSVDECIEKVPQINGRMSYQQVHDNCYTIEAVNSGDISVCQQVSESFRPICLAQFE